jgi:16S rRNA (cytosine1402-N4)-methyltransferase
LTAADIWNKYGETELIDIFQTYADESTRAAKNIARAIIQQRTLASTSDLLKAIALVTPKFHEASRRKGVSATSARIFQSLRIVVNREDEAFKVALLSMTPTLLRPGGHLVVISYHSMEDLFTKRVTKDGDLSEKRSIFVDRDVYWNVVDRMR